LIGVPAVTVIGTTTGAASATGCGAGDESLLVSAGGLGFNTCPGLAPTHKIATNMARPNKIRPIANSPVISSRQTILSGAALQRWDEDMNDSIRSEVPGLMLRDAYYEVQ
jgi:hypothetical protein